MLQSIRERSQGWIAWTIIGLISLTFVLWGAESYFSGAQVNQAAALVNKKEITLHRFNNFYNQLLAQQEQAMGDAFFLSPALEAELKKIALNQLIREELLLQTVSKNGYVVTPLELQSMLLNMFQQYGAVDEATFQQILTQFLQLDPAFIENVEKDLLINQLESGVLVSDFALPNEVEQAAKLLTQTRDISYAIISPESFESEVKDIDFSRKDTEIEHFYKENQSLFVLPEQFKLKYVLLDIADLSSGEVSVQEIENYYQENLSAYTQPKRWHIGELLVGVSSSADEITIEEAKFKAEEIAKKAQAAPDDFPQLVKEFSDDPFAAKKGGVLDWFDANEVESSIAEALNQATAKGSIIGPIRTQKGFLILKLLDIQPEKILALQEVKDNIRQQLLRQQAEQEFVIHGERLLQLAFEQPDSLEPIADELDLKIVETDWITQYFELPEKLANPKVFAAAQSDEVLMHRLNSDVIELTPEQWVVIRVAEHRPAKQQSMDEVKDVIVERLRKQAQSELMVELGNKIEQSYIEGLTLEQLAETYNINWLQANDIHRYAGSEVLPSDILQYAFSTEKGKLQTGSIEEGGYAVVLVEEISYPDSEKMTEEELQIYKEGIQNAYGQLSFNSYLQAIEQKADIEIVQQVSD